MGRGFTIIEMMVAVSVAVLMFSLINVIFVSTQDTIIGGIAVSDIIRASRAIGDQLELDSQNMVGPQDQTGASTAEKQGGYLIITNRTIDARVTERGVIGGEQRAVRSDQVIFIINVPEGMRPLSPGTDSYANTATAGYAKVVYGHGVPRRNGAYPALGSGANAYASEWVLFRQAMFLSGDTGYTTGNASAVAAAVDATGRTDVSSRSLEQIHPGNGSVAGQGYGGTPLRVVLGPTDRSYGEVALTHAVLAPRVSDFIVEYAGDYDSTTGIDRDATTGEIIWYSGVATAGEHIYDDDNVATRGGATTVFRASDDGADSDWPYLIRVRYRMHDSRGDFGIEDPNPGTGAGNSSQGGIWQEHVIEVNRP